MTEQEVILQTLGPERPLLAILVGSFRVTVARQCSPVLQVILQRTAQRGLVGSQSLHVDFLAQYLLPCLFFVYSDLPFVFQTSNYCLIVKRCTLDV